MLPFRGFSSLRLYSPFFRRLHKIWCMDTFCIMSSWQSNVCNNFATMSVTSLLGSCKMCSFTKLLGVWSCMGYRMLGRTGRVEKSREIKWTNRCLEEWLLNALDVSYIIRAIAIPLIFFVLNEQGILSTSRGLNALQCLDSLDRSLLMVCIKCYAVLCVMFW